jgi:hypothetical protein
LRGGDDKSALQELMSKGPSTTSSVERTVAIGAWGAQAIDLQVTAAKP